MILKPYAPRSPMLRQADVISPRFSKTLQLIVLLFTQYQCMSAVMLVVAIKAVNSAANWALTDGSWGHRQIMWQWQPVHSSRQYMHPQGALGWLHAVGGAAAGNAAGESISTASNSTRRNV